MSNLANVEVEGVPQTIPRHLPCTNLPVRCSVYVVTHNVSYWQILNYDQFRAPVDASTRIGSCWPTELLGGSYRKSLATIFCKVTCFIIDKPNTPP